MYQRLSGALPAVPPAPAHIDGAQPLPSSASESSPALRRSGNNAPSSNTPAGARSGGAAAPHSAGDYNFGRGARQLPPSLGGPGARPTKR